MNIRKRRCTTSLPYLWNYPFTRNGFTSGNNGRLGIPEYVFEKGIFVKPTEGSEIWRIKPDGTEELIAIFEKEQEKFVQIKK